MAGKGRSYVVPFPWGDDYAPPRELFQEGEQLPLCVRDGSQTFRRTLDAMPSELRPVFRQAKGLLLMSPVPVPVLEKAEPDLVVPAGAVPVRALESDGVFIPVPHIGDMIPDLLQHMPEELDLRRVEVRFRCERGGDLWFEVLPEGSRHNPMLFFMPVVLERGESCCVARMRWIYQQTYRKAMVVNWKRSRFV